ncbi:phytanoyl-CoA dioxygenase PhyH [Nonomuraea polychroma]|uniref:Phytanoyl-CoA dioxygenase PhyH n=2 Tax=Nonomuraea polychroma TaxID=46176 RepID=A0A438M0B0_9ACTN|nr:phytanoyl-CoA dioxygenase PhyH [Nonomuraea polychroma]
MIPGAMSRLHRDGYLVLPGLLAAGSRRRIRAELAPLLMPAGRDPFRSRHTRQIFGVLHNTRAVDALLDHQYVVAVLDRLLLPNFLLSKLDVIERAPGAAARPPSADDDHYPVPRPRPALSVVTTWTLDEGATFILWPGSHRWPSARRPDEPGVPLTPPPGSCVIILGTLWHGTAEVPPAAAPNLTITAHYCEPWLRTREAFTLSPGREVARQLSRRVRHMLGYSVHPPDTGLVDGMHPQRLLT